MMKRTVLSLVSLLLVLTLAVCGLPVSASVKGVFDGPYAGDVNGDGAVNSIDALLTLQCSVQLIPTTAERLKKADVNGDWNVNASDALLILQRSVRLISYMPVEQITEDYRDRLAAFSARLYEMTGGGEGDNYVMSPISVYMALNLLYAVGDEASKAEILAFSGMTAADLELAGELVKRLDYTQMKQDEYGPDAGTNKLVSRLSVINSLWIDDRMQTVSEVQQSVEEIYNCDSFRVPFSSDNLYANQTLRDYVKEKTNGLIDQDFALSDATLLALVNTLYFKDVWKLGHDLPVSQRTFYNGTEAIPCEFLIGRHFAGREQVNGVSRYFYTETQAGYKMYFVMPTDGHTLDEAMTADNLSRISRSTDLGEWDENHHQHFTSCIFPAFTADSKTALDRLLRESGALSRAFTGFRSPLTACDLFVNGMQHRAVVRVDKTGIEGAAVTVLDTAGAAYDPVVKEYHDFMVDHAFGFLITDPSGVILFAGKVTDPTA